MNREVQKAMQEPPVRERFKALAVNARRADDARAVRGVREEASTTRYAKLIPELGIK